MDSLSTTPSRHGRTPSANIRRQPLQRRSTKGPLGLDDPFEDTTNASIRPTPTPPNEHSIISEALRVSSPIQRSSPQQPALDISLPTRPAERPASSKDFSFLLRPEIYQPLNDLDLAPPFRNLPLPPASSPTAQIAALLSHGRFHTAATQCAYHLTHSMSDPTNHVLILSLFHSRLACLQILSRTAQAAEESKALQDLSNPFYLAPGPPRTHLLPWSLRVLAARLQAIGFADSRRAIVALYELAREARLQSVSARNPPSDDAARLLWGQRLRALGVDVANALVETGDLEGAARHLTSLRTSEGAADDDDDNAHARMRLALVYLRLGDLDAAARCFPPVVPTAHIDDSTVSPQRVLAGHLMTALRAMGPTSPAAAVEAWDAVAAAAAASSSPTTIPRANLAVALLYAGRISPARALLEELILASSTAETMRPSAVAPAAVLFNLCTVFELTTERAAERKMALAERLAARVDLEVGEMGLGEFKL